MRHVLEWLQATIDVPRYAIVVAAVVIAYGIRERYFPGRPVLPVIAVVLMVIASLGMFALGALIGPP